MRLINTRTLKLHEFNGADELPAYAILSHRWGKNETNLQDLPSQLQSLKDGGGSKKHEGASKVASCCAKVLKDGWSFVVS